MTTFGLRDDSLSFVEPHHSAQDPNIDIVPPDNPQFSSYESGYEDPDEFIDKQIALQIEESPLVATQPLSQFRPYEPQNEQHLVGLLIPSTDKCEHFQLSKHMTTWRIGRHSNNDLVLDGNKLSTLSNFHCTLRWNGKLGKQSEVVLVDSSLNGTWVNNTHVSKGNTAILRGGVSICFGGQPDAPNNHWRYTFRDIEGQSDDYTKQIWAKYDLGHELGSGAFARVHKCIERATGDEYAVKIIDRTKLRRSNSSEAAIIREIAILRQLADFRHKNIVALREHFEEDDSIYLILELVRGGDLLNYIGAHGALHEQAVRRMAAQICHAVAYIHSQGITHRDLKPENVMITATNPPNCKVADFGLAKLVGSGTFLKTMCGTPAYLAPEVMLRSPSQAYDNKVDSWSLGVIFYCMLTNHAPFPQSYDPDATPEEQRQYWNEREVDWRMVDSINLSEEGHDFLRHLLVIDPRKRPTVASMLDHSWIAALVPSDSQFQHPLQPFPPTPTTDGVETCKSFENLHLSDMAIPGLSLAQGGGEEAGGGGGVGVMPGAYPQSQSQVQGWSQTAGGKRKDIMEGSSPLSSLSSSEAEGEPPGPPPARKRRGANVTTGTAAVAAVRKPPSRRKRLERETTASRRSARKHPHPVKAPRYT